MPNNQKVLNIVFGSRCNLSCRYCFEKEWPKVDYTFDPVIIDHVLYKYKNSPPNKVLIRYFGGEPMLYWDQTKKCIEAFKECKFEQQISTNGTFLTEEIVDTLNKYNMRLFLSHDGSKSTINRGLDVLEDRRLFNLISKVNNLTFVSVTTKDNTVDDIVEYFKHKFPFKYYSNLFTRFRETTFNAHIDVQDPEEYMSEIYKYSIDHNISMKVLPKTGIMLCSDGTFRNPMTNNILGKINKVTLEQEMDSEALALEKKISSCEFEKCPYNKYCGYTKMQVERNTYCKEMAKAVKKVYEDPYWAVESVTLYLGNKCNQNCIYCRDKILLDSRPEASDENIQEIINFLHKFKFLQKITFVGGEPLIYIKYIKHIVEEFPNLRFSVITNGTLLKDNAIFNFLKDNKFSIALSHDGISQMINRKYEILDDADILSKLKWFNFRGLLAIQTVITKDNINLLKTFWMFRRYFQESFHWRLMFVKGEDQSKLIPIKETTEFMKVFFRMFKYEPTIARCLYAELHRFIPINKNKNMYMDLDKNIGIDPMDTIHPFSEENYVKYISKMRNLNFPTCTDCSMKHICHRNPSNCNKYIIALRENLVYILKELCKDNGYGGNFEQFINYVSRYI